MENLKGPEMKPQDQVETVDTRAETTAAEIKAPFVALGSKQTIDAATFFSKTKYSIGNAKKIMNGKYGGAFYVNYLQDSGSKTGHLQLIIEYPDGQIKRVYLAKNCFKESEDEGDGIAKIESDGKEITPTRETSLHMGDFRILEKYETPKMPIPAKVIWKIIIDNYEKIPVQPVYKTEDFEGIYWKLYEIAVAECQTDISSNRQNEVRFLVTKNEMEEVAIENGYTLSELRKELNANGMLIKDKPRKNADGDILANSYQLTKKINGKNERFYAIRKKIDVQLVDEQEEALMEFTDSIYETEAERKIRDLKELNNSLKCEVEAKERKIKELYRDRIDDATDAEIMENLL